MPTRLNPYLAFRDTAREAMTFYQSVFGGELTLNTFAEYHASEDPECAGNSKPDHTHAPIRQRHRRCGVSRSQDPTRPT